MAPPDFRITRIAPRNPPTQQGQALLQAAFDLEIEGLRLRNCFLASREGKGFTVFGPSKNIAFQGSLASDVKNAAAAAFEALRPRP
ncbi:hypothetical protein [Chachezhania sediminis]|uniref:hypothetical protein n=1 Tax=Chachezhania sediminis TaxID=2599291 RepID=UPI0018EF0F8C|nr:hypothetical protein [Chachezhania sediminis]